MNARDRLAHAADVKVMDGWSRIEGASQCALTFRGGSTLEVVRAVVGGPRGKRARRFRAAFPVKASPARQHRRRVPTRSENVGPLNVALEKGGKTGSALGGGRTCTACSWMCAMDDDE